MFLEKRLFCAAVLAIAAAFLISSAGAQEQKHTPPLAGFPVGPSGHIDSYAASPAVIQPGQSSWLTWAAVNSDDTSIDQCVGIVPTRGMQMVTPKATTTYTFTVGGRGGNDKRSLTVIVVGTTPISPEEGNKACPAITIPQMDGHPDLSGVYIGGFGIMSSGHPTLKPGADKYRIVENPNDLGQGVLCVPPGVPAATMQPYPLQIIQKPHLVVILYEAYGIFRVIPLDVQHPPDLDPTYMGNSVGHWEGNTLVVDATGFNDKTEIAGFHHTTAYHVEERYTRTSYDTVMYTATVTDPNVFSQPFTYTGPLHLHPEWQIQEYVCEENNQNYQDLLDKKK
ncbi:MAG: hypothetical protein WBC67_12265 [Candidatus Acidiferrales bacterium]